MNRFRRHARNLGYILLATAGVVALKCASDYARADNVGRNDNVSADNGGAAFISLAYIHEIAPYLSRTDSLYTSGSSRISTDDLSELVYICAGVDEDGIRHVSVTFNGIELINDPSSDDPRNTGFRHYGLLHPDLTGGPGVYHIQLRVTDQKGNTMTESAVVELRPRGRNYNI